MSINNRDPPEAAPRPPKPHQQCLLFYHEVCKVCWSLYNYSRNLRWTRPEKLLLGVLSAAFGWLRPLSRIAVGCDQQLVRRVMSPPAQHHAGAEHAQHLEDTARVGEKTAVI